MGEHLWKKYEDTKRPDTISRYLQHCTTFRTDFKEWYPDEMMREIRELLELFEKHLPRFNPATDSRGLGRSVPIVEGSKAYVSSSAARVVSVAPTVSGPKATDK